MPNRKRDSKGRFETKGWTSSVRGNPGTSAAVAAGSAGLVAAGAYMWSHREQISRAFSDGISRLNEWRSEPMRSQEEISEEALTLKETGRKSKGPRGPIAQQDIKAGMTL